MMGIKEEWKILRFITYLHFERTPACIVSESNNFETKERTSLGEKNARNSFVICFAKD